MSYKSLLSAILDLEQNGHLFRVKTEVDPCLEMAEIQRRAYQASAPALLFENVKNSTFPAVSNLFGTIERARYIFRHTLRRVQRVVQLKADPTNLLRQPFAFTSAPLTGLYSLPMSVRSGPALKYQTTIANLPSIKSWPKDGGGFITLPQVYTENPNERGVMASNLGMYRIQLSGGEYQAGKEIGLHYQLHRGIGIHHTAAHQKKERLKVSIFVGGPPAHTMAAIMPLPEGLTELLFAGMLNGRRFRYTRRDGYVLSTEADFVITGTIDPERTLPEGPFGDHLGYYSLAHPFPVLDVETVYHRKDAVWPFTVVGRPPQEDTTFGKLIHEITEPMVPIELPGVKAIHAVDAAGVHPLLLAIGSERYVPYENRAPRELLTNANAILGFGQASLAKYLFIAAHEDDPHLNIHDISIFFRHILERVDLSRDLHFLTNTTIDTLDYSGTGLNRGSKLVVAAAGEKRRSLATTLPTLKLPTGFDSPSIVLPGVMAITAPQFSTYERVPQEIDTLANHLSRSSMEGLPLTILTDDATFASQSIRNFLWVTFTRSNPSHDVHGIKSFTRHKHWGCQSLIIDARLKPHHAPPLIQDPLVSKRVDEIIMKDPELRRVLV